MRFSATAQTFLWGLFCACSWTWCIGMYLPKIMIEQYGWPGFIVFAISNVLGCAAMGYVVKSAARSRDMMKTHAKWMVSFSAITIAYHAFFLAWFFSLPLANLELSAAFEAGSFQWSLMKALPIMLSLAVCGVSMRLIAISDFVFLIAALVTYALSLIVFQLVGTDGWKTISWTGSQSPALLAWTAPTIFFGFLLCPYLDATFHRAMQNSPSRHAFSVFGITFFIMILMTCALWFVDREHIMRWLSLHIVAQSVFTVGAHSREIVKNEFLPNRSVKSLLCILPLAAAFIWPIVNFFNNQLAQFDVVYLRFLAFYGLLFPAYIWLFMGKRALSKSPANIVAFVLIVLVSVPLYELGFFHQQPWWLLLPLIVLICWKFLASRATTINPDSAG